MNILPQPSTEPELHADLKLIKETLVACIEKELTPRQQTIATFILFDALHPLYYPSNVMARELLSKVGDLGAKHDNFLRVAKEKILEL